jgi:hypothetical protein
VTSAPAPTAPMTTVAPMIITREAHGNGHAENPRVGLEDGRVNGRASEVAGRNAWRATTPAAPAPVSAPPTVSAPVMHSSPAPAVIHNEVHSHPSAPAPAPSRPSFSGGASAGGGRSAGPSSAPRATFGGGASMHSGGNSAGGGGHSSGSSSNGGSSGRSGHH